MMMMVVVVQFLSIKMVMMICRKIFTAGMHVYPFPYIEIIINLLFLGISISSYFTTATAAAAVR